jgi:hypothetical protein
MQAETRGDTDTLGALATPDFRLVGPAGFILTKQQWLTVIGRTLHSRVELR